MSRRLNRTSSVKGRRRGHFRAGNDLSKNLEKKEEFYSPVKLFDKENNSVSHQGTDESHQGY